MTHYFVTRSEHERVYMVVYRGSDGQIHLESSHGSLREAKRVAVDLNRIASEHADVPPRPSVAVAAEVAKATLDEALGKS